MNRKARGTVTPQKRLCCESTLDHDHEPGCAFKRRSLDYNADLRERLDRSRELAKKMRADRANREPKPTPVGLPADEVAARRSAAARKAAETKRLRRQAVTR